MNDESKTPLTRSQFSLRSMLWFMVIMAINAYLLAPRTIVPLPLLLLITIAVPPMLMLGVLHGTSNQRSFCLGALFLATPTALYTSVLMTFDAATRNTPTVDFWYSLYDELGRNYHWHLRLSLVATNLIGFACLGLRWLLERQRRQ
jgi:hypothetical protein